MSDEEYRQEGINMQLKPIKDKIKALEAWKKTEEEQHQNITKALDNFVIDAGAIGDSVYSNKLKSLENEIAELKEWVEGQKKYNKATGETIDELKEKVDAWIDDIRIGNKQRFNLEEVLQFLLIRVKDWGSFVKDDNWHIQFCEQLEKLDSKQAEKKEYKIIKYCSFYAGGEADGDCQLYGSGDITKSRKCKDIYCQYKISGGEKEGRKTDVSPVRLKRGGFLPDSKLPRHECPYCHGLIKFCRKYKDDDEDIIYEFYCSTCKKKIKGGFPDSFLRKDSGGELITIEEAVKQGKIVEKLPEPQACFNCYYLIDSNECNNKHAFSFKEFIFTTFATGICNNYRPMKPEPEKEFEFQLVEKFIPPRGVHCENCMNNPVPKLIEGFKDKLEFLRDKVLEAPILSGSVQDLRDHIHDLKDLVIKNINEYEGLLNK